MVSKRGREGSQVWLVSGHRRETKKPWLEPARTGNDKVTLDREEKRSDPGRKTHP